MIPVHPVAGPDPRTVRWKMPAGTLPVVGEPGSVPPPLARLVREGVVTLLVVGEDHLEVTLGAGHEWREQGARVRAAILAALEEPGLWQVGELRGDAGPAHGPDPSADARLYEATAAALAGEVGELARSHGGLIELESVQQGVVTVRMHGACRGCPAAALTLQGRLETRLRETCPQVAEVTAAGSGGPPGPLRRLLAGRRTRP